MKFTEENVLKVEHLLISDLVIWEVPDDEKANVAMYIAGVHDMAQALIEAMEKVKKT